ncbi:MAG: helix-hairpin-helix domain-containing protein [Epsilonproteobacteria bacterium]|nr:helix-hairpin-helix domain-containing protein [Campylobacterota bacterium]
MRYLIVFSFLVSLLFGVVDINNATKKELVSLKGIGVKKAEAIIAYRQKHCFENVDALVKVKGIGKKTLQKNRANLKAGECRK